MNFTFFSSAHGNFSRIDHILGHKSSLVIFSDHNTVRLDVNYKKKKNYEKFKHMEAKQHTSE